MFVVSMIVGGKFISPEGSSMLCHYCFGNGDTLEINSHYISKSPVEVDFTLEIKERNT